MGIHFLCPNGHHLNVKKELAGKVGYCPKCRARLIVPNIDETTEREQGSSGGEIPMPNTPESDSKTQTPQRSETLSNPRVDLDDSSVLWYVRALNGEQYGPAVGSVLQSWIQERRIGPQMLVWRQGWETWEEAEKVFPDLRSVFESSASENAQEKQGEEGVLRSTVARFVDSYASGRPDLARRKRKAIKSFYVILGLIGLIVVLLIALITVLFIH